MNEIKTADEVVHIPEIKTTAFVKHGRLYFEMSYQLHGEEKLTVLKPITLEEWGSIESAKSWATNHLYAQAMRQIADALVQDRPPVVWPDLPEHMNWVKP